MKISKVASAIIFGSLCFSGVYANDPGSVPTGSVVIIRPRVSNLK